MTSPSEPRSGTTPDDASKVADAEPGARPHETSPSDEGAPSGREPAAGAGAPEGERSPAAAEAPEGERSPAGAEASEGERSPAGAEASEGERSPADTEAPDGERPPAEPRRRRRKKARGEAARAAAEGEGEAGAAASQSEGEDQAEGAPVAARGEDGAKAKEAKVEGAKAEGPLLGELREAYLRVDRRLLGLFRIYFGFVLLVDVLRRVPEATFFYSSSGSLSNHYSLFAPIIRPYFSLYTAFSTTTEVRVAFLATALVHVFYIVGYRTKLMQVLAFALYAQLNARNTFVENGGTVVFSILACWTMFLPLGDRFSVDALRASLRARREHAPEALDDRAGFRAPAGPHYSLVMVALAVQIAAIYFFNTVHKTGATWRNGESIHWVLWQNRIATNLAAWLRMHEPGWLSPLLTRATLIIEGAAPILVFSPFAQKYLRTAHVVAACSLHIGISLLMTLGPFSYVMIGLNLLMLPPELFDWAAAKWAAKKPRLLVAYDPADGAAHQLARLLARLDSLDRLRFVSADAAPGGPPEGGTFFVRDDAGGPWAADGAALVACLRALPLGSLARLAPARALADRFFARRAPLAEALHLRPGRPDAAPGPAADLAPGPHPLRARLGAWRGALREACVGTLLVAAVIQISRDNAWVPRKFRFEQPAIFDTVIMYPRMMQGWRMFSPDAPKDDGTLVVDAVTVDGRHLDPLTGAPPDFEAPLHGPWLQSQLWCDYFLRISWDHNSGYREELKKYLLNWQRLEHRPAQDRIKSFEIWWVTNESPPPGSTTPFNINKRLLASSGRP
ncbi:MAG TPA: HTTM domain-containing protein [Polyangiaceae bacterium]|nr:HTTM domain-containing protein [Polyangiaceae bacterium]